MNMRIDPTDEYDQQVYDLLKKIQYDLKMHDSNKVTFIDTYLPHNNRFYTNQFIIDKLVKKGALVVLDCYQSAVGANPVHHCVNFNLKINIPFFYTFYEEYKKAFELIRKTKLVIYKNTTAELIVSGESHKAKFSGGGDSFDVLILLAKNKDVVVSFDKISEIIKRGRKNDKTEERRARDAVQYIKVKKFKYSGNDFIQTCKGFRLVCDVELKS